MALPWSRYSFCTVSRPISQKERADTALAETYGRGVIGSGSKNWKSQSLLVLAFCATFAGGILALFRNPIGIGLFVVGLPALVATAVWCIRNWDY